MMQESKVTTSGSLVSRWQTTEKQHHIFGSQAFFFYTMTKNAILLPSSVVTVVDITMPYKHACIFFFFGGGPNKHTLTLFLK